ncbi:MAG: chromosome partitioning protein ParA [Alteromonadaceae bacterium]|nr:MAG: chromosome partitioning protein ParA [Alteromonadaceae bacterium]
MEQIFVVNPKGGCGKTTVSTQLAAYFAIQGRDVLLVDHDAQRSSTDWLASRPLECAPIRSVAAAVGVEVDIGHADYVIHDMPAAWSLEHVEDIIHASDRVLIPVLASPTDIKACLRFVMGLNRSGVLESGVQVGMLANRVKAQIRYRDTLTEFLSRLELPLLTTLRDTQNYVRLMDQGKSIFDSPNARVEPDVVQWQPVFDWIAS